MIVTVAFVPALVLLPFFPSAHRRAEVMVRHRGRRGADLAAAVGR
ncbi:hypothetical protein ABZ867_25450 [Streptomyces cinnamoneus]